MPYFDTDIRYLKGVGEKRSAYLRAQGIDTIGALLRYYPRQYDAVDKILKIADCTVGEKVTVSAKLITPIKEHFIRKNMTLYKFNVSDGSGIMGVTIYNNKYAAARLNVGTEYLFTGKTTLSRYEFCMSSPQIREVNDTGIHPIYPASAHLSSRQIEKYVKTAFQTVSEIPETLPQSVISKYNLMPLGEALFAVHFPKNGEISERARRRLVFEELFILKTGLSLLKGKNKKTAKNVLTKDSTEEFCSLLPFSLTNAQRRVINECVTDMMSGKTMNRLVEGDVGSGKTAVAAALMYSLAREGVQSAMMAPTEILAEQHFEFLSGVFKSTGVKTALITGSTKKKEREKTVAAVLSGEVQVVVGTHALISDDVCYKNLGLVITDEQHRFGVSQRASLAAKGENPHTLVMSATPIPRTLGLIIYGDLELSILDEYPKGRQQIATYAVTGDYRKRVFAYIKKHLDKGLQGYIVCPMVEENEEMPVFSAEEYYSKIKDGAFKGYNVGLLHGKMKPKEKEKVMRAFKDGEISLLVCTTVIEVGIDVKKAAIMVIENAERFGLSALHQLRGRVGRGTDASSCILISDAKGMSKERLSVISGTCDGFKIAEEDLKLRGPGDFLGQRQHGLPELKIADLYADSDVLRLVSAASEELLKSDPHLKSPQNSEVRKEIIALYKKLNEN